ncbi:MAG TPA: tripartite tricarboxylate transporter substrate binding protein, partial [Reyranella sp.]|nr:tripartite tricarboxylate transporter substrate binding protein [Reyranella sp.]
MHATHNRREILKVLTLAALAARGASALAAETFPSKPIHMVVPYAAGGTTDQMARVLSQPMGEQLGQPIIVENRPGAGGAIGTDYVVRSRGDGYTLVFGNAGPNALLPLMRPIAYDPVKDLRPISLVAPAPLILAVSASSPARNLKEFLVYARKNDGSLNIGSVGNGSMSHLSAEYFN